MVDVMEVEHDWDLNLSYTFLISKEDVWWQKKMFYRRKKKKNTKEETNVIIENKSFITGHLGWLFVCYFRHFNQGKYPVSLLTTFTNVFSIYVISNHGRFRDEINCGQDKTYRYSRTTLS